MKESLNKVSLIKEKSDDHVDKFLYKINILMYILCKFKLIFFSINISWNDCNLILNY